MSAYVCDPEHIGRLAAFLVATDPARYDDDDAQAVALTLARQNEKSVRIRYPDSEGLPGPVPPKGENFTFWYRARCSQASRRTWDRRELSPVDVLGMVRCYEYQTCEDLEWIGSEAWRLIDAIRNYAIAKLDGFDAAPWEYTAKDAAERRRASLPPALEA